LKKLDQNDSYLPFGKYERRLSEVRTIKIKQGTWWTYDATDGLPGGPNCLVQDSQGYLWIGTTAGLCRYDGTEFITYTTADGLADNGVRALCEDSQGRLWIGAGGGGVSCFDGKRFTIYTAADGLADNRVSAICEDSQRRLWIGTDRGLSCFDGHGFTTYTTADGLVDNGVSAICEDSQGKLWIVAGGVLSCFDGHGFTTYTAADGLPAKEVTDLCADSQGRIWIALGHRSKGVFCFDGQQFTIYTSDDGLVGKQSSVVAVYEDHHGRLWFGGWDGVSCFDGRRFINYYTAADGLWASGVFDIIEDGEGQIWFAHGQMVGLSCFDAETTQLLTDQSATWVADQDKSGRIWFNSRNDIYGIRLDSISSEVEQRKISFNMGMIGLMVDSGDHLWISPYRDGTYRYDSTDVAWESAGGESLHEPRHYENNGVPLLEVKDGTIWFNVFPRLSRFHPERFMDEDPIESIDANPNIVCPIEDRQGRLWIGGEGIKGLICRDGSKLIIYTQENGLPSDHIRSLLEDDDGNIWIGTEHGLCCYDGKQFINFGEGRGLKELFHWDSVKDTFDHLWFATWGGGIYRTDGEHFQWLTEEDGLPSNLVVGLLPQTDGSMIICTARGVVRYQPTAKVPPQVEIREVMAVQVYRSPRELEITTVAATHASPLITISYHGSSLATRRMRYSYILEDYDEEWKETWETQVRYEHLPAGEYTFKVIAINRDMVCSESPATLRLTIVSDPRDEQIAQLESELERRNRELEAELQDAREMQMSLLPKSAPQIEGFDIAGACEPATAVGGDYFTYLWLDEDKIQLGIVLMDVTGHGMKAATTTFLANGMLRSESRSRRTPDEIMTRMHQSLQEVLPRAAFVGMSFSIINLRDKVLTHFNAGQPAPVLIRDGKPVELSVQGDLPLGVRTNAEYLGTSMPLSSGDVLLFFSDGLTEAENDREQIYEEVRMWDLLGSLGTQPQPAQRWVDAILTDVRAFAASGGLEDDLTVVVVRVL
jgi:serine phosphatase RsbU (regulator of sigma subunit)/ligand-binding sensor domain-containing protein